MYKTLVQLVVKRRLNGVPSAIALEMAEKELGLNKLQAYKIKKDHTFSSDIDSLYYASK